MSAAQLRILMLGLAVAAVGVMWWRTVRPPRPGVVAGSALAIAGAVRLVTEPLRPSLGNGPLGWYAAAIAIGLALAVVLGLVAGAVGSVRLLQVDALEEVGR